MDIIIQNTYEMSQSSVEIITFFYQRAIKWTLLTRAEQTNPLSDPLVEKKSCATREKKIYFTRVVVTLALLGHQTSHSQNKFFFPQLHNVLLPSYCSYSLIPLIYFPFRRWKFIKFTLTFPACIFTIHNTTTSVAHFSYIFLIKTKFRFAHVF